MGNITAAMRLEITQKIVSGGHYPQSLMAHSFNVPRGIIPCVRESFALASVWICLTPGTVLLPGFYWEHSSFRSNPSPSRRRCLLRGVAAIMQSMTLV